MTDLNATHVLLHTRAVVTPDTFWYAWTFDPLVLVPVTVGSTLYARGVSRLWRSAGTGRGVARWQALCFASGIAVLLAAQVSPIAALGGTLFSAHMIQHVLIIGLAAPLLVLGAPGPAFAWALPRARLATLRKRVLHTGWFRGATRALTLPLVAWTLHGAAIWVWHEPGLYSTTVHNNLVHAAQHFSFFATALLFWGVAVRRAMPAIGVFYIFTTAVHGSLLGALLVLTSEPVYLPYLETAPLWSLTALEDQQLGGLIMWVPAGLIYFIAALLVSASLLSRPNQVDRTRGATAGPAAAAAKRSAKPSPSASAVNLHAGEPGAVRPRAP